MLKVWYYTPTIIPMPNIMNNICVKVQPCWQQPCFSSSFASIANTICTPKACLQIQNGKTPLPCLIGRFDV